MNCGRPHLGRECSSAVRDRADYHVDVGYAQAAIARMTERL